MKQVSRSTTLCVTPLCSLIPQSIIYVVLLQLLRAFSLNKVHYQKILKLRFLLKGGNILIMLLQREMRESKLGDKRVEESSFTQRWIMVASQDTELHYLVVQPNYLENTCLTPADWNIEWEQFTIHGNRKYYVQAFGRYAYSFCHFLYSAEE